MILERNKSGVFSVHGGPAACISLHAASLPKRAVARRVEGVLASGLDRRTAKPSRHVVQDGEDWLQERELLDQYGKIGRATKAAAALNLLYR